MIPADPYEEQARPDTLLINEIRVLDGRRPISAAKVEELATSIGILGLLQPILVRDDTGAVLVAGAHRIEAHRKLGRGRIDVRWTQHDDPLVARASEIAENLIRSQYTKMEEGDVWAEYDALMVKLGVAKARGRPKKDAKFAPLKDADEVAKESGTSKRTRQERKKTAKDVKGKAKDRIKAAVRDAKAKDESSPVADLADNETQLKALGTEDEETQCEILDMVDSGDAKDVKDAKRQLKREKRVANIVDAGVPTEGLGQFHVLYADPPWRYEHSKTTSREVENQYPTMTLDAICDLPVADLTFDDCVLFLWVTSPKLAESVRVVEAWGFDYRTCMVWVKGSIGPGYYARQRHELLFICTKGKLPVPEPSNRPDSVIEAPRGKHSAKPEEARELIDQMYPEYQKLELFSRTPRDGWAAWGNQA